MAADCGSEITIPCDVGSDQEIEAVFQHLDDYWDHLDIIVHSVAFAPREELEGEYLDPVTPGGFPPATPLPPGPAARWRPRASRTSAPCSTTASKTRPCAATSPSKKWAMPRPSFV